MTSSPTPKVKMRVFAVLRLATWGQNHVGVGLADCGPTIGEEDDDVGPGHVVGAEIERLLHGAVDRGSAGRFEAVDPLRPLFEVLGRRIEEAILVGVDRRRELDHVEAIARFEVLEAILEGRLRLGQSPATHGAGGVEDEDHVASHLLRLRQLRPRRDQQAEVARLTRIRPMEDRRQADVLVAGLVEELEVLVEHRLVLLEADRRLMIAGAGRIVIEWLGE